MSDWMLAVRIFARIGIVVVFTQPGSELAAAREPDRGTDLPSQEQRIARLEAKIAELEATIERLVQVSDSGAAARPPFAPAAADQDSGAARSAAWNGGPEFS